MRRQSQKKNQWIIAFILTFLFVFTVSSELVYAAIPAGQWKKAWDAEKAEFKKETGKKKPKSGKMFHSSGIDKALEKADKAYKKIEKAQGKINKKLNKKTLKALKKAVNTFEEASDNFGKKEKKYLGVLKKAIKEEGQESVYGKNLKILKTRLKEIESSIKQKLKMEKQNLEAQTVWLKDKSHKAMIEQTNKMYYASTIEQLDLSVKQMRTGFAKIKSKPTIETLKKIDLKDLLRNLENALASCEQAKLEPQPPGGLRKQFSDYQRNKSQDDIEKEIKNKNGEAKKKYILKTIKIIRKDYKKASAYLKDLRKEAKKLKKK